MKRVIAMLGLTLALTGGFAGAARAADATPASVERMPALDGAILTELNATRAGHGLRPLTVSPQLEEAAVAHSREMLDGGFFAHDSPGGPSFVQRLKHFYPPSGYSRWSAGENLIYNSAAMDANEAIQVWLDSPPHRENMLDPTWREVGIGSLHATSAGGTFGGDPTWVITMDFGTRSGGVGAAKPVAAVQTVATHKTVAASAKNAKKAAKAGRIVARVDHITEQLVRSAKPKQPFTPPLNRKRADPGHTAKTTRAPEAKTKINAEGRDESNPKKPSPKRKPTRTLPNPVPSAPSVPVPTSPDTGATTRQHYGDAEQGEFTDDSGTPPEAPPAPSS